MFRTTATQQIFETLLINHRSEISAFLVACEEYGKNPTITQQIDDLIIISNILNTESYNFYNNIIDRYLIMNERDRIKLRKSSFRKWFWEKFILSKKE